MKIGKFIIKPIDIAIFIIVLLVMLLIAIINAAAQLNIPFIAVWTLYLVFICSYIYLVIAKRKE